MSGDAPQDPNPQFVEIGKEEELKENKWKRDSHKFSTWKLPSSVEIVKDNDEFKLEYKYDDGETKKKGDKIKIELPRMIRAEWQTKWADLAATLEKDPDYSVNMSEDVSAVKDDKAIEIASDHSDTLDLKGHTLDGKEQSSVKHVFDVKGTLTVKDSKDDSNEDKTGVIKGGKTEKNGGGALVEKNGKLTLEGGSIENNSTVHQDGGDPGHGGGVYIDGGSGESGSFEMKGGSVKGNKAYHSGGGVYITENGTFAMSGGEIFGNRARYDSVLRETTADGTGQGGGVYVGGSFSVSGKVVIKDNIVDEKANNVYLPNGKTITVTGKLDEAAEIHVSMEKPGVITSGLNANDESEARGGAQNFVSDDPAYEVFINYNGEAALRRKVPEFDKTELELGGVLKLRFYMSYPEGWDPTNDRMEFTVNGKQTRTVAYNPGAHGDGKDYFACPVNAYQMADKIQAVYYFHDLEVVRTEYTIKENLEYLKEHSTGSTLELVKATMNYGHYIQPYLAQVNHWTVGVDHLEMPAYGEIVPAGNPAGAYGYEFKKTPYYNEYVARTELYLTLDAGTALNVRVLLKDGGTVTAAVNNSSTVPVNYSGNNWVISVPGVPANLLGTQYLFSCSVDGHKVFDFKVSALSYVNIVLGRENSPMIEQNALTALFDYALAAQKYVNVA